MNNDEKILKALEALQADVKGIKETQQEHGKRLDNLQMDITAVKTTHGSRFDGIDNRLDDLQSGQDRIETEQLTLERGQVAIKGMIQLLNSNFVKTAKNFETRIKNLEEHTGTENPLKQ